MDEKDLKEFKSIDMEPFDGALKLISGNRAGPHNCDSLTFT